MNFQILNIFLMLASVYANTEKVIFWGPEKYKLGQLEYHSLCDLHLELISPRVGTLRTHVRAEFPTNLSKNGAASWFLLESLSERQKYEVRICWSATQPTSFHLRTYTPTEVSKSLDLTSSLKKYCETRTPELIGLNGIKNMHFQNITDLENSNPNIFLQVLAAADYYTMNATLMQQPVPVNVDIILDPYIFNVIPKSLIPTAVYMIVLAKSGWLFSKFFDRSQFYLRSDVNSQKKLL